MEIACLEFQIQNQKLVENSPERRAIAVAKQMMWTGYVCCVLRPFSPVHVFVTLWTIARQAPLSMGYFRQEYWSALPYPPPGDLLTQALNPCLSCLLHWQVGSSPLAPHSQIAYTPTQSKTFNV